MKVQCRAFNSDGMAAVATTLAALRADQDSEPPVGLLTDPSLSEPFDARVEYPAVTFASRWHLGLWLFQQFSDSFPNESDNRQAGFWTWLAYFLFGIIRPRRTKVGEDARYILNRDDFRKRYRHLVAGPFYVLLAHASAPQAVRGILATPPAAPGELYEQFAARKELITSDAIMQAITSLYYDSEKGTLKRGSSGSARRLADVLMQYDVTYDFASIPSDRLLSMLPHEFRRFMQRAR
jgi:hypothetical protein